MKKFFAKAFEQGFIAVLAGICTSPMLIFAFFFGKIVVVLWVLFVLVVFTLGGFIDWCGSSDDEEPYYIHD